MDSRAPADGRDRIRPARARHAARRESSRAGPRRTRPDGSTHARGQEGERQAEAYLEEHGYVIVARNARTSAGEIDRIALDGRTLCFVEIRLRSGPGYGTAAESVDPRKQRRLLRAARGWLALGIAPRHAALRFDVVAIDARARPPRIELYRDAFAQEPSMR